MDLSLTQEHAAQFLFSRYQGGDRMNTVSARTTKISEVLNLLDRDFREISEDS